MLANRLKKGDTIGICAPASPVKKAMFLRGVAFLKRLGLKVKFARHIYEQNGYLAGGDDARLADFHELIADRQVKGIIFARGGYGCARFIDKLDFDLIKENPKVIWGFSDITFLHLAIFMRTNLVTFHGPMVMSVGNKLFDQESEKGFEQLFTPTDLLYDETFSPLNVITEGTAIAPIIGGNLSLLVSTLGTEFEVDFTGRIIFLEDVNENVYKIDRKLNQLRLAGKLKQAAGFVIGDFKNVVIHENEGIDLGKAKASAQNLVGEVMTDYLAGLEVPVMSGFKIGHCWPHFAIPHGTIAQLNTAKKELILQQGVK